MEEISFDEGLGVVYERLALGRLLKNIADKYRARKILELDASIIGNLPAFNSFMLALWGYDITLAVREEWYDLAKKYWKNVKAPGNVNVIKCEDPVNSSLESEGYDLVWNHLVFQSYDNGKPLLEEMKRLAKKAVMVCTYNPWNIGYLMHMAEHRITGRVWDHGKFRNNLISKIKSDFESVGIKVVDSGGVDTPPWLDTIDTVVGGKRSYMKDTLSSGWRWEITDERCRQHKFLNMLLEWEFGFPKWFTSIVTHHPYVVGVKK